MEGKLKANQIKRSRFRQKGAVRWTDQDTNRLLEFMKKHPIEVERPTAQIYYKNLASKEDGLKRYTWTMMRDRVRNLRAKYNMALEWRNSTGYDELDEDEKTSVRSYLLKMCPFFDHLECLYGDTVTPTYTTSPKENIDSFDVSQYLESTDSYDVSPHNIKVEVLEAESATESETTTENEPSMAKIPRISRAKTRLFNQVSESDTSDSSTALEFLAEAQKQKIQYLRQKLKVDIEFERRRLELEEKRLALEVKKNEDMANFRKMELRQNLELEKWKIEMELKYKYNKI